jgi:hypothetical protein
VAAVANLNLSVANVALPSIGAHFDSSQTTLDLIAVGYSLGLACSDLSNHVGATTLEGDIDQMQSDLDELQQTLLNRARFA